jgi:hypothetical protein
MRIIGILLLIFGAVLLIYGGLTVFIPADTLHLGTLTITNNQNLDIVLPPFVGLCCALLGILLMLSAPRYYGPPPY